MLVLAALSPAFACPTVATGTPSGLSFDIAQVAITRQGDRTTFSVSVNPVGDEQPFALVLPVSEVLPREAVATLDPLIFARLNAFTAPRHVADAGCPQSGGGDADGDTDADSDADADSDTGVDVEAEYLVGEYQVVILSAEESFALQDWLDDNEYFLPEGAEPLLQEYIEAGSFFLAAKVAEEAQVANGTPLSPLQISYTSDVFGIPIRLATLNSPGEQDMVVYAITDRAGDAGGRVGIASYAEFDVKDRCIWGDPRGNFDAFYEEQFTSAWTLQGDAAWTREFAGGRWDCNPCTGYYLDGGDLHALGYAGSEENAHLTRLRMRYTPDQAWSDLVLYGSGIYEPEVTAFADDYAFNYSCVEQFCDGTPTPGNEGGGDDSGGAWGGDDDDDDGSDLDDDGSPGPLLSSEGAGCGCASSGTGGLGWVGFGVVLAAAGARRRA